MVWPASFLFFSRSWVASWVFPSFPFGGSIPPPPSFLQTPLLPCSFLLRPSVFYRIPGHRSPFLCEARPPFSSRTPPLDGRPGQIGCLFCRPLFLPLFSAPILDAPLNFLLKFFPFLFDEFPSFNLFCRSRYGVAALARSLGFSVFPPLLTFST